METKKKKKRKHKANRKEGMHKVKSRHVLIDFYRPEKCPVKQKKMGKI